jgi:5-oxoprolinase (ATP-hydrolysing) subunit A
MRRIDLNADVGEGYDDRALLPLLTSVNVACGGHAGDERTMADIVRAAAANRLAVGAHPSYPDRKHFGRRAMAMEPAELRRAVSEQVSALAEIAAAAGARLAHVKPHGALYNTAARDLDVARTIAQAVRDVDPALRLVGLAGSQLLVAGREMDLAVAAEGFVDRHYTADGSLASRSFGNALIQDDAEAADQALRIVCDHRVCALDGTSVDVRADTLCIHGDTDGAAAILTAVRRRLEESGVVIVPL